MSKLLRIPSFKVKPGTVQTYDADFGTDSFGHEVIIPITTRCPEWKDESKDWTGRVVKESKHLPICWGPDTIRTYFNPYHLSNSFIRNTQKFEAPGTLLRRPKCIIFCNYALANSIDTVVNAFKDQFEKQKISVLALQTIWPTFVVNGLPVKEITLSDPIGIDDTGVSYEMPTLLEREHFTGGQVMVISDFDQAYKGNYGINYFPYYPTDLAAVSDDFDVVGQIPDCIKSFDKINNYIYFFCETFNSAFFQGVLNTNAPGDYFNVNVFGSAAWQTAAFTLCKSKLYSDIADFFGLTVP